MHRSANGCVLCMQHARHGLVVWSAAQRRASSAKIGMALVLTIDRSIDGNAC
jgi:hypothetical protein